MKAYIDNENGVVSCIIYEQDADEYTKSVMHEIDMPEGLQAVDENGYANYKMVNGELAERTAEEKQPQPMEYPKSQMEAMQETLDMVVLSMLGGGGNV